MKKFKQNSFALSSAQWFWRKCSFSDNGSYTYAYSVSKNYNQVGAVLLHY